jgi:phenylalanyl-tRNA synthetase beta chain
MIFSTDWLKEYVKGLPSPQELEDKLTLHSVEVEGVVDSAAMLEGIVVGKITTVEKHPDADRLNVCTVQDGEGDQTVVCGGSNVREGMTVAMGRVGAKVQWHGEGDLVELKPAKIRGVESFGMICAAAEIGLGAQFPPEDEREVLDLTDVTDAAVGTPLSEALTVGGALVDIDNKSMTHRTDLFCHIGMAREIAAVFDADFTLPELPELPTGDALSVSINSNLCSRYMGAELSVEVGPAPEFIRKRLQECGVKSINNVVDITNYVMLEWGEPMHAFDADTLDGDVQVRLAQKGEKLATLDKEEKELDGETLVIADNTKPIAVAGVIGGLDTGVTDGTKRIILEAATFDALTVRQAAQKVGSRTDSAMRWEKGIPSQLAERGMARAIELLQEHAGATLLRITDVYPEKATAPEPIELSANELTRLTGVDFETQQVEKLLDRVECTVQSAHEGNGTTYHVTPPWFRGDLTIKEDIIEEIVRLYGPTNIPEQKLTGELGVPMIESELALKQEIRGHLSRYGATEVYNYSFYGEALLKTLPIEIEPFEQHVEIENPLSEELRYLRTSLLPRLLENVSQNVAHAPKMTLFEVGHIFPKSGETHQLGIICTGTDAFRRVKGLAERLFQDLGVMPEGVQMSGQTAHVADSQQEIEFGVALVALDELAATARSNALLETPSTYPAITLDWSLVMDNATAWGDVEDVIRKEAGDLLQSVQVFDIYRGDKIPSGKKSLACQVVLQSSTETLKMKKIESWRDELMSKLSKQFDIQLRDK